MKNSFASNVRMPHLTTVESIVLLFCALILVAHLFGIGITGWSITEGALFCFGLLTVRAMTFEDVKERGKTKERTGRWLVLGGGEKTARFGLEYQIDNPGTELFFLTKNRENSDPIVSQFPASIDTIDNFDTWIKQSWTGVLVDDSNNLIPDSLMSKLMQMNLRGLRVYRLGDFYEQSCKKIPPSFVKVHWFTYNFSSNLLYDRVSVKIKRVVDILGSGLLLIATLPALLLVALAIKLDSPGPIFYSQERTGQNGKQFHVYKMRSMYQNAESRGAQWASSHDPRITRVGRFLRLMRIDELPQLWNVLKGEMSLIGPRPERPIFDDELRKLIPYYDVRYVVKPGITGWAQVNYPYGASVEDAYQKLAYDIYYIKNYSLWLDAVIALKTVWVVLTRKGQ